MKSLQHKLKENRHNAMSIDINVKLVAVGIEVCKMKSAGLSYKSLVSFLSFCGVDIGNIGHGRCVHTFKEYIQKQRAIISTFFQHICNNYQLCVSSYPYSFLF
jgi:hypothetical protein